MAVEIDPRHPEINDGAAEGSKFATLLLNRKYATATVACTVYNVQLVPLSRAVCLCHRTLADCPCRHKTGLGHSIADMRWRGAPPRWCNGKAFGLAISRSRVQILLEATLRKNLRQVVYTYVPLSPSSITWYRPKGGDALRLGR